MANKSAYNPKSASGLNYGLVSYWRLDESSGNASDSVGLNTLTNYNTAIFSYGKINNGVELQASSAQYLQSPSITIGTAFSIAFWFRINNGGNYEFILQQGTANGNFINIAYVSDNKIHYSSFTDEIIATTSFSNNTWTHCVITNNGSNSGKIYLNGSLDKSGTVTKSSGTSALTIGRRNDTVDYYMNGMVDEVGLWSRELTSTEVTELYNSGSGKQLPTQSLATKLYLPLDGNSVDISGNGNHGTNTDITYQKGKFGQCAVFNGSTSRIACGTTSDLQLSPTVNISLWYKSSNSSAQILISKDSQQTGGHLAYGIYNNFATTGDIAMRVRTASGTTFSDLVLSGNFIDNKWYHVVASYDAGVQKIYVNGQLRASGGSGSIIYYSTPQILNVGCSSIPDGFFSGQIDEVIIENRAWSSQEVYSYYKRSVGNYKKKGFWGLLKSFLIEETLSLVETVTSTRTLLFTVAENLGLVEAWTTARGKIFTISETLGLVEGYSYLHNKVFTIAESLGLIEILAEVKKKWNSVTKSTTNWTNTNKNTTTWTEENKNTTNWTNINKN